MEITLHGIHKQFKNESILEDVSIAFESGKLIGVIGPNGSGKSVLLKMLCGLMHPDTGHVSMDGHELKRGEVFHEAGIILDKPAFYEDLTAFDNLKLLADINGKIDDQAIMDILKKVELTNIENKKVKKFSLGMKQRLAFAQAIMEDQKILLLDEFTNALDEEGCDLIKKIVKEEVLKDKIVIVTSHIKDDIYGYCDMIYRIKNKKLELVEHER